MGFDPVEICSVLAEEGVEFVVLGGFAAVVHGSPLPTEDIDIVPSRTDDNLERLARALRRLDAKIRTSDEPVATTIDAAFIRNMPHMVQPRHQPWRSGSGVQRSREPEGVRAMGQAGSSNPAS